MRDQRSEESRGNLSGRSDPGLSVERVDPSEIGMVARLLAAAYEGYPLHTWAMPKTATQMADATLFFEFYLRRIQLHSWDVFATADRSAVIVTRAVRYSEGTSSHRLRLLPTLVQKNSQMNDFFQWIESFRPTVDHRFPEFLGCLPNARRGTGFLLLASVLRAFEQEHLPVWTWTTNPSMLPLYRRLGFEISAEHRRDAATPAVTLIWRAS